jgi:hypothetical protein
VTASTTGLAYGAIAPSILNAATSYIVQGNPSAHVVEVRFTRSLDFWNPATVASGAKF